MRLIQIYLKLEVNYLLAVCYGAQYLAHFSGEVAASNNRENMVELIYLILKRMKFSLKGGLNSQV
jgi:GMP synthase-like glutamine amidotransferase